MSIIVETPFQNFTGLDGKPLTNGKVYIGQVGTDPTVFANQIPVFWDEALTIPASQPLMTNGGYIVRTGSPSRVYVSTDYSMSVKNASNVLVYYLSQVNAKEYASLSILASSIGASLVCWMQSGIGAVLRFVQDKLRENVSIQDFQSTTIADGDDVTAALQAAINSLPTGGVVKAPRGLTLLISSQINFGKNITLDKNKSVFKQKNGSNLANMFFVGSAATDVYINNGKIDVNVAGQSYSAPKGDAGRGIFAYQTNGLRVKKVDILNPYGSMILAAASNAVKIEQCNIDDKNGTGHYGIEFNECTHSDAIRNTGTGKLGVTGYGIYVHGSSVRNRALKNSFQYWQIVMIGTDYISPGVPGATSSMLYCQLNDNTLLDPSADTSIHFGLYGSVCGNIIINSRDVGISMDYSRNIAVNNNVIHTTNAGGIAFPGCIDCTFIGNDISDAGSQFVSPVDNGQRSGFWGPMRPFDSAPSIAPSGNVITSNTIRDRLGVPQMYFGISIANVGGANVNYVSKNYITGSVSADLDVPSQTNIGSSESRKFLSLLNGWVSVGSGVSDLGYYKDDIGNVYLSGVIANGALNLPIAVLPLGYRPAQKIEFIARAGSGVGLASIFTDGSILLESGTTTRVSFNLVFTIR